MTDGLLHGVRGGVDGKSAYGHIWHTARKARLARNLLPPRSPADPHDLRHAALSLRLNATSAPAPATAPVFCARFTCTASTARKILSASRSKTPSTQTPAADGRHSACKQAVLRTVGSARDPVRYMSVNRSRGPRIAHTRQGQQTHATKCIRQLSSEFPQLKGHLNRSRPTSADCRIRPTRHSRRSDEPLPLHAKAGDARLRHRL